jgi:aspartyl aminopeptidase
LTGQEFLIAGEVFASILEQAKELNKSGYKDPAAVLTRVVIEDALRRLARREGVDDKQKASQINDDLKGSGIYPQVQWRFIQAWLDIGNAAAHGKFGDYTEEDVVKMIEGVEQFLAAELRT